MTLADIIRGGLYAIDTPGALTRAGVANLADFVRGEDRFQGWRASGRDVLESMGMDRNQPGLDAGDVAGVGVEMALDPLNWGGLGWAINMAKAARAAKATNALRAQRLATGGMPEEVAKLTKAVDAGGNPLRTYHGTAHAFDKYDMAKADQQALFGSGIYMTDSTRAADGYTGADLAASSGPDAQWLYDTLVSQGRQPNMRMQYVDVRNPLDVDVDKMTPELGQLIYDGMKKRNPKVNPAYRDVLMRTNNPRFAISIPQIYGMSPGEVLKESGYDAIRHEGGLITGGPSHNVLVAFDPSQIYSPWIAPAERAVPRISPLASALAAYNAQKAYPRQ